MFLEANLRSIETLLIVSESINMGSSTRFSHPVHDSPIGWITYLSLDAFLMNLVYFVYFIFLTSSCKFEGLN